MRDNFKIDFDTIDKVKTWKDFDELFTRRVYPQYPTLSDYYSKASCLNKIKHVKRPTLVIHSRDDPIVPIECLPVTECQANPRFIVGIVEKGGHVCYFQGVKGQKRWYPLASSEYLDAVIQMKEEELLRSTTD